MLPAMVDNDARWLEAARRHATPSRSGPGAGADPDHAGDGTEERPGSLGPEARRWTESLLDVGRFELARADEKANTLFRFYGVVAALSIGLLAGRGWTPTELRPVSQVLFWTGCAVLFLSGVYLGRTLYPRSGRGSDHTRLLYFGHVLAYPDLAELEEALRGVEADADHRTVEQLVMVSRIVQAKYALTRRALVALAVGTALCLASVLLDLLAGQVWT
jgi:hypothetical protein